MRARACVAAMVLAACGISGAQEKAVSQEKSTRPSTYNISGTLLNAITGDPLPKAKVWVIPVIDPDTPEDATVGAGQGPGGRGPRGGGGGPGPGGGARAFAGNRGQRGQQQQTEVEPKTETFTDANGRFVIEGVYPGKYTMYAERKGFPRQALDRHAGFNTAVIVGEGKDTQNIVFRAVPDSGISGRITDDYGDPVPNAQVILFYKSTDSGQDSVRRRSGANTDAQGRYHFSHLPPGTYYVVVSAQPWYTRYAQMMGMMAPLDGAGPPDGDANLDVAFGVTYYSNSNSEDNATPIALGAGEHFQADMTMNTVPAVHIAITGSDPKTPMFPGLSTTAFGQQIFVQSPVRMTSMPGEGQPPSFAVSVAPGRYEADVRQFNGGMGGGPPTNVRRQMVDAAGGAVLDVTKGEEPAPVTGVVKFEGTPEIPRGNISFRKVESGDSGSNTRTNNDGEIETTLYPGKYHIVAGYPHYVIKSLSATGAKITGRTIEVTGASPIKLNLFMSKDDARIDGTVHALDSDAPVAGAYVILVPEDMVNNEPLFRRSQSGTDGSFQFTQVIPGKYTLVALQNGWNVEWAKPDVMQPYLAKGEVVEVGPKAKMNVKVEVQ